MDRQSTKNLFQMIQKLFRITFDGTVIMLGHSDLVKAKVDRGEPTPVIRMGMTPS